MYLRNVIYQLGTRLKSLLPCFHKSHHENLIWLVVGMVYARRVSLPAAAGKAPGKRIQREARVQRFERLLQCPKFVPLEVLRPVVTKVLRAQHRRKQPLVILMDRSMINDTLNLLHVALAYGGRALPLGWVRVPHEGNSDLALQQALLSWLQSCLPAGARPTLLADREFHSIHLAQWVGEELGWDFVLRMKGGTFVECDGSWLKAGDLAERGRTAWFGHVKVTKDRRATYRVHLVTHWAAGEDEPWLLLTNLTQGAVAVARYAERFWIEEMFSDHKSRGLNLEATRLTDPDRLERLLVAVTLAYLWIMEVGVLVVVTDRWRYVDNRGAARSVSLCQIGLRWLEECLNEDVLPPFFTGSFKPLPET